jgi:hypothetical protein
MTSRIPKDQRILGALDGEVQTKGDPRPPRERSLGEVSAPEAKRPAKGDIETILVERLLQPFGFPHIGVQRPVIKRVDAARNCLWVLVHQ